MTQLPLISLQKLQNGAARILTESSFDASSGPIIKSLDWKTIRELVDEESKLIFSKSIYGLASHYVCDLFTRNSLNNSYSLRNTANNLKIPKKTSKNGLKSFS